MKKLKNYVKNHIKYSLNESYLNESVWDIEDNVESDNKELMLDSVKKFIEDNYKKVDLNHLTFVFDKEKEKYIVSSKGDLTLVNGAKSLVNDLFEWDTVKGWFDCSYCPITTLEGSPKEVGGWFDCTFCQNLESLKGAPEYVGGEFDCYNCPKLTSLEGAPREVGVFNCNGCVITSLQGSPNKIKGDFFCSKCSELKSLKGAPKEVKGDFYCPGCPKLSSLDGIGKVKGKIFSDIK